MNDLVTVVVPIYNVEKYLERCILSLIHQTYRNLEIILVDDGSPDNCPQMCDDYAKKDSRIKVIHKQNAGLGMARNTGIEQATGEYICFFDSDDYIAPDTIEIGLLAAKEHGADLIVFGKEDVTPAGEKLDECIPCPPKQLFVGEEIINTLLPMCLCPNLKTGEDWRIVHSAWNKLYSMSVIKKTGWRFVSEREIISEDYYSLTELYGHLERVCVINRGLYHYTVNTGSLSRSYRPDRFERIKEFYKAMLSLSNQMNAQRALEQAIKGITFGLTIGAMKHIVGSGLRHRQKHWELKKIVEDDCLQEIVRTTCYSGCNLQKKLLYWAVKHKQIWLCFLFVYLKNKQDHL